jgi:hypothetical protein
MDKRSKKDQKQHIGINFTDVVSQNVPDPFGFAEDLFKKPAAKTLESVTSDQGRGIQDNILPEKKDAEMIVGSNVILGKDPPVDSNSHSQNKRSEFEINKLGISNSNITQISYIDPIWKYNSKHIAIINFLINRKEWICNTKEIEISTGVPFHTARIYLRFFVSQKLISSKTRFRNGTKQGFKYEMDMMACSDLIKRYNFIHNIVFNDEKYII